MHNILCTYYSHSPASSSLDEFMTFCQINSRTSQSTLFADIYWEQSTCSSCSSLFYNFRWFLWLHDCYFWILHQMLLNVALGIAASLTHITNHWSSQLIIWLCIFKSASILGWAESAHNPQSKLVITAPVNTVINGPRKIKTVTRHTQSK